MGRTLPSATIVFQQEEAAFSRFRRALRRSDQLALDDLFTSAHQHLAAAQYASHALPFEVFLLSMLLEEHKEVMRLRDGHEVLRQQVKEILKLLEAAGGLKSPAHLCLQARCRQGQNPLKRVSFSRLQTASLLRRGFTPRRPRLK